jgi:hypothetical protein
LGDVWNATQTQIQREKKLIKGQPLLKQCDDVNETQKHVTTFLQRPLCTISSKPVTEEV